MMLEALSIKEKEDVPECFSAWLGGNRPLDF